MLKLLRRLQWQNGKNKQGNELGVKTLISQTFISQWDQGRQDSLWRGLNVGKVGGDPLYRDFICESFIMRGIVLLHVIRWQEISHIWCWHWVTCATLSSSAQCITISLEHSPPHPCWSDSFVYLGIYLNVTSLESPFLSPISKIASTTLSLSITLACFILFIARSSHLFHLFN